MPKKPANQPIGERLRAHRIEILGWGLRETAKKLAIAPAHLTDLEKGRRTPSDALLVKISEVCDYPIAELRAGWSRPEAIVEQVASQDATTAMKVPEFLRTARNLPPEQWDKLIRQAQKMADAAPTKPKKRGGSS